ncbi:hypothetical protein [Adlercreutzia caecimuris]|uniref:hypothetical protein n=1 Tax=Adlercreutzia caecimuris TaxID=671266 RepID=UPI00272B7CC6|nr:hypothetical protein [Adlercreutzia caecimuris]
MRYEKHSAAKKVLKEISHYPANYLVIHYSCESFYNIKDGRTPRITSIAVREYDSAQTHSFSIHKIAEKYGVSDSEIELHYDNLERAMLDEFFQYVEKSSNYFWIHWNMRDINYGFDAIRHRYEVLGGTLQANAPQKQIDAARLLKAYYGDNYAGGHPRLESILKQNDMIHPDFLTGAQEAEAFDKHEYVKLHQSTLRKANCIASLVDMSAEGKLQVCTPWYETYGTTPQGIYELLRNKWWFALLTFALGLALGHLS